MKNEKLIQDAFDFVRNSPELGRDSMSTVDECWDDADLKEEIEFSINENGKNTAQEIFDDLLATERLLEGYAEEIRNA